MPQNHYFWYGLSPKAYEEKRAIKKAALTIGGAFLVILAISVLITYLYIIIKNIFSIPDRAFYDFLTEPAMAQIIQIAFSITCFTLCFALVFKIAGYHISSLVPLKKVGKDIALPMFFFGMAFCSFANIATAYLSNFFSQFGFDYDRGDDVLPKGVFGFLLVFIARAVVPALVEEFACRGLVLGSLRRFGDGFAILISAILFGLVHSNFEQIPFAFMVGLILGFAVVKTNSLRVAIVIHFCNNFISVFFSYFLGAVSSNVQNLIYLTFLLVSLLLGILFLSSSNLPENLFSLKPSNTESTEKQKYKWFFTSPAIIIFSILCIIIPIINYLRFQ